MVRITIASVNKSVYNNYVLIERGWSTILKYTRLILGVAISVSLFNDK